MHLVFIGIPGCGKGTQARILSEKYGFDIFETGLFLRKLAQTNTTLGKLVKKSMKEGKQVDPDIIEKILQKFISNSKSNDIIFDGLVRNIENKLSADKILDKNYKVIYFDLPKNEAIKRLLGRMYNPRTGQTFPSGFKFDPKTKEKLVKRLDDNDDTIRKRIEKFFNRTLPVIELYKKEGRLITINANKPIEEVANSLQKKLNL